MSELMVVIADRSLGEAKGNSGMLGCTTAVAMCLERKTILFPAVMSSARVPTG
jgi:hypothetical protein